MSKRKESPKSHFDNVDTDHDNRVSMSELTSYITDRFRISYGDAAELVSRMDSDGDGFVSFADFEPHFAGTLKDLE